MKSDVAVQPLAFEKDSDSSCNSGRGVKTQTEMETDPES